MFSSSRHPSKVRYKKKCIMLLNHSFFSVSRYQHPVVPFVSACTSTFMVFLFFFRFPSCTTARSSQSFYKCDSLGNSYSSRDLMRPQLLFLGSIPNVFKWENLGFKCKVFLWKLFFPFEKYFEREICSSLLPLAIKQSVSQGDLLQVLSCWLQSPCLLGFPAWTAQKRLQVGFR